jgi:hypothetical protein
MNSTKIDKERVSSLYDITDWGKNQLLMLLDSGAPLIEREAFWNEYHEKLILWALKIEENDYVNMAGS